MTDDRTLLFAGTDENCETFNGGPIVDADLYDGEKYDSRLDDIQNSNGWSGAKIAASSGKLTSTATFPSIKVVQSITAISIAQPLPQTFVFDFGQNFSGWVLLRVSGESGCEVRLRYSEVLNADGTINPGTNRAAKAIDSFVLNGSPEQYFEPRFTYHGFRYVEVTGFPGVPTIDSVIGKVVHTDMETTGSFACSNDLLNKIHRITVWTQLSNLMGIPTDSPQRDERLGWLQDAMLSAEEAMMNFGMCGFLEKFLVDIADSQKDDGSIPDVVPPLEKGILLTRAVGRCTLRSRTLLYLFYGDVRCLEEHFLGMKKWVEYEESKRPKTTF